MTNKTETNKMVEKKEKSVNTPLHFNEKNIIKTHDWHDILIKREFFRVANLIYNDCKTISIQTNDRLNNCTTETQVYLPRSTETQTLIPKKNGQNQKITSIHLEGNAIKTTNFSINM